METLTLWARHGDAVRQALAWGELVHRDTASEAWTDADGVLAIQRGLLAKWADALPDPRGARALRREGLLASFEGEVFS